MSLSLLAGYKVLDQKDLVIRLTCKSDAVKHLESIIEYVYKPVAHCEEGYSRNRSINVIRELSRENVIEDTTNIKSN